MEPNKTAIERAFELARTGRYSDVSEIKDRMRNEGYFTDTVTGPILRAQLKRLMEAAQKSRWPVAVAKATRANRSSSKMVS
jgi:hypothetical protein